MDAIELDELMQPIEELRTLIREKITTPELKRVFSSYLDTIEENTRGLTEQCDHMPELGVIES